MMASPAHLEKKAGEYLNSGGILDENNSTI